MNTVAFSWFRDASYLPTVFPAGSQYTPVSYNTMTGYVGRFSEYPEASYCFLRSLSQHPELLLGLPDHRSGALSSDYASFYEAFNEELNTPNLILIPNLFSDEDYYASEALFQAFDHVILEDGDLLQELKTVEQQTREYFLYVEATNEPRDCVP